MGKESRMKSPWKRILRAGCLGTLLLIVIISIPIIRMVGKSIDAFKETKATTVQMRERFGSTETFIPEPGKIIDVSRVKVFLSVREDLKPLMDRIEASQQKILATDDNSEDDSVSLFDTLKILKKAGRSLPEVAGYFTTRNNKLMDEGMGLGEYLYIYAMVYYSWLGYTPDDGPDFEAMVGGGKNRVVVYAIQDMLKSKESRENIYTPEFWESFSPGTIGRVRSLLVTILTHQLRKGRNMSATPEVQAFQLELEKEIKRVRQKQSILPWQGVFPAAVASSLQPFSERLKACYSKTLNPVEFGIPLE